MLLTVQVKGLLVFVVFFYTQLVRAKIKGSQQKQQTGNNKVSKLNVHNNRIKVRYLNYFTVKTTLNVR